MTPERHLPARIVPLAALLALLPALAAAAPLVPGPPQPREAGQGRGLTVEEAIRSAWAGNAGLRASSSAVEAARADAARARDSHLPTLSLVARGVVTDEPLMAFGLKLDQGRISPADFDPRKLNDPGYAAAVGGSATLAIPLYAGGRISAGSRAARAAADAEGQDHLRRRAEVGAAVVEAYFGAQAAEEGVRYAEDLLSHAGETERFVRGRSAQGLALDADLARASAFRAQAEAERATALQRRASARSALVLLAGDAALDAELVTSIAALPPSAEGTDASGRPDVVAARLRADAGQAGISAARGALLPAVFAQASAETLRTKDLADGRSWTSVGVVARWDLSLADADGLRAASARARAATDAAAWREREANREVAEARRAVDTAALRIAAASEAVTASESARALRAARHRQGLLPLTDVLDAEAGLAGARALLLASRLEARVARARLALALNQPVEGLAP